MRSRARHSARTVGCAGWVLVSLTTHSRHSNAEYGSIRRAALAALPRVSGHALAAHGRVRAQPTAGLTFLIDGVPQGALRSGTTGTKSETWPIAGKGVHSLQVSAQPQPQPRSVMAHRIPYITSQ